MTDIALQPQAERWIAVVWRPWMAPLVAALLVGLTALAGWRGTDLPAQLYRVGLFHRQGFILWDSQWYGGHWTLAYSTIFPPLAGIIGVHLTEVLSVGVAALAFDRLVVGHFGRAGRLGSIVFTIGTLVPVAIGQLTFLLGEALALAALWAATRHRRGLAVLFAIAASLASPLAGAFLMLAALAWLLATWPERRLEIVGLFMAAALPIGVMTVLFPGQGRMPFPFIDFLAEGSVFLGVLLIVPRRERALRIGLQLYLAAFVASFVLQTAVGGNVERLGEAVALPLVVCVVWSSRRVLGALLLVPLAIMQWGPAYGALTTDPRNPSTTQSYYEPLLGYVDAHDVPVGRLEIVPTSLHWEATYVAPTVPLARGWERQLDTADNPLFYSKGALTPATYDAWLLDNGVNLVALPDVPLDYAAVDEGQLVAAGVPGLAEVWHNAHWRVYRVIGSTGIVSGPAQVVSLNGGDVSLDVTAPGTIVVKERYSSRWAVTLGQGCIHEGAGGWLAIEALAPGPLHASPRLLGPSGDAC
jgi:hypothetical protein